MSELRLEDKIAKMVREWRMTILPGEFISTSSAFSLEKYILELVKREINESKVRS